MKVKQFSLPMQFPLAIIVAEEADTDLETDRLLGQQRTDDQGFYDDKVRHNLTRHVKYANKVRVIFFEGSLIEFEVLELASSLIIGVCLNRVGENLKVGL